MLEMQNQFANVICLVDLCMSLRGKTFTVI